MKNRFFMLGIFFLGFFSMVKPMDWERFGGAEVVEEKKDSSVDSFQNKREVENFLNILVAESNLPHFLQRDVTSFFEKNKKSFAPEKFPLEKTFVRGLFIRFLLSKLPTIPDVKIEKFKELFNEKLQREQEAKVPVVKPSLLLSEKEVGLDIEQAKNFLDILRQKYNSWNDRGENLVIKEAFLNQYLDSPETKDLNGKSVGKWLDDFKGYLPFKSGAMVFYLNEEPDSARIDIQNIFVGYLGDVDFKNKARNVGIIFNRFLDQNPQLIQDTLKERGLSPRPKERVAEPIPGPSWIRRDVIEKGTPDFRPLEPNEPSREYSAHGIADGIIKSASNKNQFGFGGISSCTYNAILMAIKLMNSQEASPNLIDKVLQEASGMHSGSDHIDFRNARQKIGKTMDRINTDEYSFSIADEKNFPGVFGAPPFTARINEINKFPWACVITKSPESIMLFQREKNGPMFLYDSHGKSGAAYILSFKNIEQATKYLKILFPYTQDVKEMASDPTINEFQKMQLLGIEATFMTFK